MKGIPMVRGKTTEMVKLLDGLKPGEEMVFNHFGCQGYKTNGYCTYQNRANSWGREHGKGFITEHRSNTVLWIKRRYEDDASKLERFDEIQKAYSQLKKVLG